VQSESKIPNGGQQKQDDQKLIKEDGEIKQNALEAQTRTEVPPQPHVGSPGTVSKLEKKVDSHNDRIQEVVAARG